MPPHPVTGLILQVLVLLVATLHQSNECVVVEPVGAALLVKNPFRNSREAAAVIRAFILIFFTIVVKDASANQRHIRFFFMWLYERLIVANCTRCDAVTTGCDEAWRVKAMVASSRRGTRDNISVISPPGRAEPRL